MRHPREKFEDLFDTVNDCFARAAIGHRFDFENAHGHVRRALRIPDDPLKRGVFLEMRENVLEADPSNPQVRLSSGAWHYPKKADRFPAYIRIKVFYDGCFLEIRDRLEQLLEEAVSDIESVTNEDVIRDGKLFRNWDDVKSQHDYFD